MSNKKFQFSFFANFYEKILNSIELERSYWRPHTLNLIIANDYISADGTGGVRDTRARAPPIFWEKGQKIL